MINVQKSALGAFEQYAISTPHRFMHENDRVCYERLEVIACCPVIIMYLFKRKRLGAKRLKNFVVLFNLDLKLSAESVGVNEVEHPQSGARGFIAVRGAD